MANGFDIGCTDEAGVVNGVVKKLIADFEGGVVTCHEGGATLGVHVEADGLIFG